MTSFKKLQDFNQKFWQDWSVMSSPRSQGFLQNGNNVDIVSGTLTLDGDASIEACERQSPNGRKQRGVALSLAISFAAIERAVALALCDEGDCQAQEDALLAALRNGPAWASGPRSSPDQARPCHVELADTSFVNGIISIYAQETGKGAGVKFRIDIPRTSILLIAATRYDYVDTHLSI